MDIYTRLKKQFKEVIKDMSFEDEHLDIVDTRKLSAQEAIGIPERDDYPILKGREVMIEADFRGAKGQAFTDEPGNFSGTLKDIIDLDLDNNYQRAVFIASLNAVLKYLGKIDNTVHCKDDEPEKCAKNLVKEVKEKYGNPKIAFIGYQPGMISQLSKEFNIRATDLNPDNVGSDRAGIKIEGVEKTKEVIEWSDIIIATGSTIVNDTLEDYLGKKPVIFYGITVSGFAYLNGWTNYCYCGH